MSRERLRILLVGVGGQGVLTAARILGEAARYGGQGVQIGQLHGLAQRGGSVEGSVLIGGGAPFIDRGEADLVLGFEPLETQRARPKMSGRTRVLMNTGRVIPFSLTLGKSGYPSLERVRRSLESIVDRLFLVDGPSLMKELPGPRVMNTLMLGALSALDLLPFGSEAFSKAIEARSPSRFLDANRRAFELGRSSFSPDPGRKGR